MHEAQIAAVTVAVVSALRRQWPQLDGVLVLVVAAVVGAAVGFALEPTEWKKSVVTGAFAALTASGAMATGNYLIEKSK